MTLGNHDSLERRLDGDAVAGNGTVARAVFDITHEMSNQLAIILGSAEMLQTYVTDRLAANTTLDDRQVTKRVTAVLGSVNNCVELLDRMRAVYWNLMRSSSGAITHAGTIAAAQNVKDRAPV